MLEIISSDFIYIYKYKYPTKIETKKENRDFINVIINFYERRIDIRFNRETKIK